jgi:hypothetical protein
MIREAWIAGVVLGVISFLTWVIAMLTNKSINGIEVDVFSIIDILMIFGLSYGIYNKSRFCAAGLTVYYIIIKIVDLTINFPVGMKGAIWIIIFTTFFIRGMIGTFGYHRDTEDLENVIV